MLAVVNYLLFCNHVPILLTIIYSGGGDTAAHQRAMSLAPAMAVAAAPAAGPPASAVWGADIAHQVLHLLQGRFLPHCPL